jgi:hypothetical protein
MKKIVLCSITLAVAVLVTGKGSLHAAVVTINSFDPNGNGSAGFTVTPSAAGDPTTYSFTRTADLDGGTIDDTLSFDFVYTMYTGSSFDGTNVTLGTSVALVDFSNPHYMNNYVGDPNTNTVEPGNSFTVSITNISYTSGEGFNSPGISFDGFNSIAKFGGSSAVDIYLGTTGAVTKTVAEGTGTTITLDGVTTLAMTTALTSGTTNQRWRDLNFSFTVPTAIPEPASAAMLLMGSLICLARRRAC